MCERLVSSLPVNKFTLWDKMRSRGALISFDLELTARCNLDCRHCYINRSAGDQTAKKEELSLEAIKEIGHEAVSLGAISCLITGGEPLLRKDFVDVYLALKRLGLLVSVFTNATLITEEHVRFFQRYPPRIIEVTVYGVTESTYGRVTRRAASFEAFGRGLSLLLNGGLPVRLKAMAIQSNLHELPEISQFSRERTMDYFRFDPFLHLRYDGDPGRNEEIRSERLSAVEVVELERSDPQRFRALKSDCDRLIIPDRSEQRCNHLLQCGAGIGTFTLSHNGTFRLCASLCHSDCAYDLRTGTLTDAWRNHVRRVRDMRSDRRELVETCLNCPLMNLCMWCPAHAHLETGQLDAPVGFFCDVAHARKEMLTINEDGK